MHRILAPEPPEEVQALPDTAFPRIDGYRILRVIGHGGMSTVYLG